jgi:geranylgeranyl pyrophosphate synthase
LKDYPFLKLIQDDLEQVESTLRERPPDQHEAINVAIEHLMDGGGKRLRPILVLLSARLCGAEREPALLTAAAIEMLHTATLVHDDLIDGALMRRGVETLNARWSPFATVLTGDYIFARAASLAAETGNVCLVQRFAETLRVICDGEVRQMFEGRQGLTDREKYERRIYAKTASLIALAAEAGPILAHSDDATRQALRTYGEQLGLAFQIVDDVLDFVANEETLGKPVGSDLRQGLVTLPVILCLESNPDHPALQQVMVHTSSLSIVEEAVEMIAHSPAIEQSLDVARSYADRARSSLSSFPPGPYHDALLELAEFTVCRRF